MPVGIPHRALVTVERLESAADREEIGGLLQDPVDVWVVWAPLEVVLADKQVVKAGGIKGVAIGLEQRAIVVAVHRKLRVSVRVAPVNLVGPACGTDLIAAQALEILHLGRSHVMEPQDAFGPDAQVRRSRGTSQRWELGREDIRVLVQEVGIVAPIGLPRSNQAASAIGSYAPAHILPPAAGRNLVRGGPFIAIESARPDFPHRAMQGGVIGHVALPDRAIAAKQPNPTVIIGDQLWEVVVPTVHMRRQRHVDVVRRNLPFDAVEHSHPRLAVLVQERAFDRQQEAGVLAPIQTALVPSRPYAVLAVHRQRDVRLIERRVGNRHRSCSPAFAVPSAHQHVVVTRSVAVPCNMYFVVPSGSDDRLPVIGRRRRNELGGHPLPVHIALGEDVGLTIPETLPNQPDVTARRGRHVRQHVWLGSFGQPHRGAPRPFLERSAVEVEIAFALLGPNEPNAAIAGPSELDHVDVTRRLSHSFDWPPRATLKVPGQHDVGSVAKRYPSRAGRTVGPAEHRRVVVLSACVGQLLDSRDSVDYDGTA